MFRCCVDWLGTQSFVWTAFANKVCVHNVYDDCRGSDHWNGNKKRLPENSACIHALRNQIFHNLVSFARIACKEIILDVMIVNTKMKDGHSESISPPYRRMTSETHNVSIECAASEKLM
jgi:hypothetical protein